MMTLSYAEGFFLYLLLWLLLIGFLAWREILRNKRHHRQTFKSNVFHCNECHHTFVPDEQVNLHRCPRCNAVCIRRQRRGGE